MDWDLVVIFTFVIVITVITKHYRRQDRLAAAGLGAGDQGALDRAMELARRLEQRMETLERVLDEDAPGWRTRIR